MNKFIKVDSANETGVLLAPGAGSGLNETRKGNIFDSNNVFILQLLPTCSQIKWSVLISVKGGRHFLPLPPDLTRVTGINDVHKLES